MSYELITLALLKLRGVGPRTVQTLWQKFPSMADHNDVVSALRQMGAQRAWGNPSQEDLDHCFSDAAQVLDRCQREGIKVLSPFHPDFPQRLRSIPNPPLILFAIGDSKVLPKRALAVIGTREPTEFGRQSARRIAKSLSEHGWVIVSGLAEGCDTAGHEGCLEGGGPTVAVLAHGFGRIYPASNKALAEKILNQGGCLVTEYPPGQPPTRSSFVERDRLQSGLSLGIIVIETDVKGGTMHTVRHATEQYRAIAAISHPESLSSEPKTQGNAFLVAENRATALKDKDDVIRFAESLAQKPEIPIQKGTSENQTELIL